MNVQDTFYSMSKRARLLARLADASVVTPCEAPGNASPHGLEIIRIICRTLEEMITTANSAPYTLREAYTDLCECRSVCRALQLMGAAVKDGREAFESYLDLSCVLLNCLKGLEHDLFMESGEAV